MVNVLIFGAGEVGKMAKERLEETGYSVKAFSDNNPKKWGMNFAGIPIISPMEIQPDQYDLFAIGLYKHVEDVKQQLIELGVEENCIIIPITPPAKIYYNNKIIVNKMSERCYYLLKISEDDASYEGVPDKEIVLIKTFDFHDDSDAYGQWLMEVDGLLGDKVENNRWRETQSNPSNCRTVEIYEIPCANSEIMTQAVGNRRGDLQICIDEYQKNILFNQNTYEFWLRRRHVEVSTILKKRFDDLKIAMKKYTVPLEEICVVSGTVLELYGIKATKPGDDLDIIMTSRFRELYGESLIVVSDDIEAHPKDEYYCEDESEFSTLTDDKIIGDERYHFYFFGVKVLILELVYRRKQREGRLEDCCLIEKYMEELNNHHD